MRHQELGAAGLFSFTPQPFGFHAERKNHVDRQTRQGRMSIPVVERKQFMVGKYEVIAQPIQHSAHMLRYTVYLDKTRIGAMVSMPSESDCRFLEEPPIVPPLKIFYVTSKPGRPKKNARPAAAPLEKDQPGYREPIPSDVPVEGMVQRGDG